MRIIAHRGASGLEPENTIRSFKKAEEIGVDMIEMDVHYSKDGEVVVFHDADLLRLFGDPRRVKDLSLAELKQISGDRQIPTLTEVISTLQTDLIVEIKVHGIEHKVMDIVKKFPHKVMISSFFPEVLKKIRTLDRNIELGIAVGFGELHLLPVVNFLTRNLNLFSINPNNRLVSAPIMALFKLSKRHVYVWTVNSQREYDRMKSLGVDGIYTDHPELIKQYENRSL
jgi:glycerophosphoryl diester phosphodiesterase